MALGKAVILALEAGATIEDPRVHPLTLRWEGPWLTTLSEAAMGTLELADPGELDKHLSGWLGRVEYMEKYRTAVTEGNASDTAWWKQRCSRTTTIAARSRMIRPPLSESELRARMIRGLQHGAPSGIPTSDIPVRSSRVRSSSSLSPGGSGLDAGRERALASAWSLSDELSLEDRDSFDDRGPVI